MVASSLFVTLALLAVAQALQRVPLEALSTYSFDQYLEDFGLQFPDNEVASRRALFEKELARVVAHNAQKASWKEGINKFSAMKPEERKKFFGRNKRVHKQLDAAKHSLPADFVMKPVDSLPKTVDWRSSGVVSAVKDQGHCGSCWAFASTEVIESHVAISSGLLFDLSVQQIAMCAPNTNHCGGTGGCDGSTAELAFTYLSGSYGIAQEFSYPYASYNGTTLACKAFHGTPVATIDGYVHLPNNNYTALMNAIAQVGPVAVNVDASVWHAYQGGIFQGCSTETLDINHVVVLVGYGVDSATGLKYWLVRNSWAPTWGEIGYIRLLRRDDDESSCAIDSTPQDGVACDGEDEPVKVCGTCGLIYDAAYPTGARAL
eukprot:gene9006-9940_t